MKRFLFLTLLAISCQLVYAQSKPPITAYFDKYWKPVTNPDQASFYRTVEKVGDKFHARDYYMSGQLQMEALCDAVTPKLIWEGNTVLYHENGARQEEGPFKNEDRFGLHHYWYDNGKDHKEVFYMGTKQVYHQYWSRDGVALLQNGNGFAHEKADNISYVLEIKDSLTIGIFSIDQTSGDSIYNILEKPAEYKGGLGVLSQDISKTLQYPKGARRAGTEGSVYVHFIVDKNGAMKNIRVIQGIGNGCDEEALRAVSTLKPWHPGVHHDKPVKTAFVLPIKFSLK